MSVRARYLSGCVLLWFLCGVAQAVAADAASAFREAQQLVAAGDLAAARKPLITAVKGDRDNQTYLQQYLLVTQAIKLQDAVQRERDPKRWEAAAQSLSLFYTSQGLHQQALPVDQALFDRLQTTDTAVQLGETLLAIDQPQRAAEVLSGLPASRATVASRALLGIAMAGNGRMDEARRIVSELQLAAETDPFALYCSARAQAAVGETDQSLVTLRRCYESVPPSRLEALKTHTKQAAEFASLVSMPAFNQVLQTVSQVPESKCSGGSSCSTCPMRGNCSSGK